MIAGREIAETLIKRWEGCRLTSYPDPATGGAPWTVGWGCTGPGIGPGLIWTQEQADQALTHRLAAVTDTVRALCKRPPTDGQIGALCSFAWNCGTSALSRSTILREFNAGNDQAAGDAFRSWVMAAGKRMPGLVNRREAERAAFLGIDHAA